MMLACTPAARAQTATTFKGKTLSLIVGSTAGGGTDLTARLVAPFLTKYLPGHPSVIVRNMPGAEGIVSFNYLVQQVKPDGLTLIAGGGPTIDPIRYRAPQSHFDPGKLEYIGGVGRGGSMLVIRSAVEKRLYDKALQPVAMGLAGNAPRSGDLMVAWGIEFLGWNAKWIPGYRASRALSRALQQSEIDMTATSNLFSLKDALETGACKIVIQSGGLENGKRVPRPEFEKVPLLADKLAGKIKDPIAQKAFATWQAVLLADKFLALPPGTPPAVVAAYRAAYQKIMADPQFNERGRKLSEVFEPMSAEDLKPLIHDIVTSPNAALDYVKQLLNKQGLKG
jgi:tripartite-type tricarboxylate transporter receptor subunit TctC